jgi:hypothetical protein
MSKVRARKTIRIGDDVYEPGDIISDPPEIVGSWILWGDVEPVEEVKEAAAKKTAAKKTAKKAD